MAKFILAYMKFYLVVLFVFLSGHIVGQDSTTVETPKIVAKLSLGKTYTLNQVKLAFVDVLSDSRCPKDVTCVWAGQAVALVEVYKDQVLIERKKVVFEPGKNTDLNLMTLYTFKDLRIMAYNLLPYPEHSQEKIKKEAYYLQLEISY